MVEPTITFAPVTADRWADLERLFGKQGAYGGCWCMFWRQTRRESEELRGDANKASMQDIVGRDDVPGILAYRDGEPAGWVSVAPREQFSSLNRSRTLKAVDGEPVWSIVCFYVPKGNRRQGVMSRLIEAAVQYVHAQGGKIVEAYPEEAREGGQAGDAWGGAYMGLRPSFERAGFVQVEKRGRQPIMRRYLP
ncbi:MAG: GNAT family N-acetyltransferase [Tepidiformaceae bacterium]